MNLPTLSVFVSSPGDVAEERALAERVLGRLAGEFADRVELRPIFWEHEPLLASGTFQEQIVRPSQADIVVCILWSRLGTRLPGQFRREDGTRYASGTEFEFEDALAGFRTRGTPDLLVYRKTAEPMVSLLDSGLLMEKLEQRRALDAFVERWFHDAADGSLRAAFHPFDGPGRFEALLERHLRSLVLRRHPKAISGEGSAPRVLWQRGSPFRGLEPFDLEHADVFFGRTRAVGEALLHLRKQASRGRPFLVVVGGSGSGKSSLTRAGLLPLLTRPGVVEGVQEWRRAVMRPSGEGGDPFLALAAALLREGAVPELAARAGGSGGGGQREVARLAREEPDVLAAAVAEALGMAHGDAPARARESALEGSGGPPDDGSGGRRRLALLVDQLEELFSIRGLGEVDRRAFGAVLSALVHTGGVWVVGTLRSDLYPRLAEVPELLRLKEGEGQYDLLPPTPSEIGEMIRQPALAAGLALEVDPATGERLDDLLVDAAVGSPGLLPLLEFTLEELYRVRRGGTLTLEGFRELGGVEGSLARRAETVLSALPGEVQEALPQVMRALVNVVESPEGGTMGAHPTPLARIREDPAAARLVDALVGARLMVTDLDADGSAVVRIAHEALLRHWPRVTTWLEGDREVLKARARLRTAAFRWAEEGRNEQLLLAPGKPLEDARAVLAGGGELTGLEQEFLRRSEWRARRSARIRRLAVFSLVVLALAASGSGWAARNAAEAARGEALAARRTHEFMVGLLSAARPDVAQGGTMTVEDLVELGTAQLLGGEMADVPASRAWAMRELASTHLHLGRVQPALALARVADSLVAAAPGVGDSARAMGWLLLGDVHRRADNLDSAAVYFERARATWLGGYPSLVSSVASRLADVRQLQGRQAEYASLMDEQFQEARRGSDERGLEWAVVLANQAIFLREQGAVLEAEALLREAEAIWQEHPGMRPTQRAEFLLVLGNNLADQGRAPEADSVYREALEIQQRILPGQPAAGFTLNGLGLVAQTLGDPQASESWLRQALEQLRTSLGEGHAQTANVRINLAELLMGDAARGAETDSLLARAIRDLEGAAPRSSILSTALQNLAVLRAMAGDLESSRFLFQRAVTVDSASGRLEEAVQAAARLAERETAGGGVERATGSAAQAFHLAGLIQDPRMRSRVLDDLQGRFLGVELYAQSQRAAREALALREVHAPASSLHARSLAEVAWWDAAVDPGPGVDAGVQEALRILANLEGMDMERIEAERALSETQMVLERYLEVAAREENLVRRLRRGEWPRPLVESLLRQGLALRYAGLEERGDAVLGEALDEALERLGAGHPLTLEVERILEEGPGEG